MANFEIVLVDMAGNIGNGIGSGDQINVNAFPVADSLEVNGNVNPFINTMQPVLSWNFIDVGDAQTAYRVQINKGSSPDFSAPDHDTGKAVSADFEYTASIDQGDGIYYWRIKLWDNCDEDGAWSDGSAYFYLDTAVPVSAISIDLPKYYKNDYQFETKWGSYGFAIGKFNYPTGIAVDNNCCVYVVDCWLSRIQKFDSNGDFIITWGIAGTNAIEFDTPIGISVDSAGYVYVTDLGNNRIQKFDSNGSYITNWKAAGTDIVIDSAGSVYIISESEGEIQKFDSKGNFILKWENEFDYPFGLGIDINNSIYISDSGNQQIQKFDSKGNFFTKLGVGGNGTGQFDSPYDVAVAKNGWLYVTDCMKNRILLFKPF